MLFLALDVGNSHTVIGLLQGKTLQKTWRVSTHPLGTGDEFRVKLEMILQSSGVRIHDAETWVISSVVPSFTRMLRSAFSSQQNRTPLHVIDHTWPFSFDVKTDFPSQVGIDRLVNAEAVIRDYGAPAIIVDNGTATTFSAVGLARAESSNASAIGTQSLSTQAAPPVFLGGAILAGLELSMHAVAQKAALLHTVDLTAPPKAIATNTSDALRSGIVLGQACLIDGMIRKFKSELEQQDLPIVATGGMSYVLKGLSSEITHFDPDMTLKGIAYCYESFCKR